MIAIIGTTHDAILYFDAVLSDRRKEKILNDYEVTIGRIFNQEVLIMTGVYSNYLSSVFVTYILQKYFILLVINVGKCISFSEDFKTGDIVVSKRIICGDVDQLGLSDVRLGQIPGLPKSFETPQDVLYLLFSALEDQVNSTYRRATIISTSIHPSKKEDLSHISLGDAVLGHTKDIVIDGTSAGMAVACHIARVPCISVKVIEHKIEGKHSIDNYEKVLMRYEGVGKAVVSLIGNIGREDIVTIE